MNQSKPSCKACVSREILSFPTLENKQIASRSSRNFHRNNRFQNKGEPADEDDQIPKIEDLTKSLYENTKHPPRIARPKTRSRTPNPSFQRSHSPYQFPTSLSTVNLTKIPMSQNQHKKKLHSPSYFHLAKNIENIKTTTNDHGMVDILKSRSLVESQSSTSVLLDEDTTKVPENNSLQDLTPHNTCNSLSSNEGEIIGDVAVVLDKYERCREDYNISLNSQLRRSNESELNGDVEVVLDEYERCTEDYNTSLNSQLRQSNESELDVAVEVVLDEYDRCTDDYNTSLNSQVRWRFPASLPKLRSSMTVPIIHKPSFIRRKGIILCRNCLSYQRQVAICGHRYGFQKYDPSLFAHSSELRGFRKKYGDYSTFVFFMALGSLTGILLVSIVGWWIFSGVSWDLAYFNWLEQPRVKQEYSIIMFIKSLLLPIIEGLNFIQSKFYKLMTLSRGDILDLNSEEYRSFPEWWHELF